MTDMTRQLTLQDWDWVQIGYGGAVLHRAKLTPEDDATLNLNCSIENGETLCGRGPVGLSIPGMFSRMEAKRCDKCCDRSGYPRGVGSPKNGAACRAILLGGA